MIINLEGTDGVGKTTVAKALSKRINVPVFEHIAFSNKKDFHEYSDILGKTEINTIRQMDTIGNNLIVDRLVGSNLVYPQYFKRKGYEELQKYVYDNVIDDLAVVWLTADGDTLKRRLDDKFISLDEALDIQDLYEQFIKTMPHAIEIENMDGREVDTVVDGIIQYMGLITVPRLRDFEHNLYARGRTVSVTTEAQDFKFSVILKDCDRDAILHSFRDYDNEGYVYEYDAFYRRFLDGIHLSMGHMQKDGVSTRRIVFTDNMGCMSLMHCLVRDVTTLNVYLRSCDYDKFFINDVRFLIDLTEELPGNIFKINVHIGSLHKYIEDAREA